MVAVWHLKLACTNQSTGGWQDAPAVVAECLDRACANKVVRARITTCAVEDGQPPPKAVRTKSNDVEPREAGSSTCGGDLEGDMLIWGSEWTEGSTCGGDFEGGMTRGDEWTEEQVSVR